MSAETVAVPFQRVGNRQVLTLQQIHELPWLLDFIGRFPSCFQYDPAACSWGSTRAAMRRSRSRGWPM